MTVAELLTRARSRLGRPLLVALLAGLALRLLLWGRLPRTRLISDEGEYLSAASWLAGGRGFAWYLDYLWTRAPVYPLFVAAHLRLTGGTPTAVFVTQTLLGLLNVALVYVLARRLVASVGAPRRLHSVPFIAALGMALFWPLAIYAQVLLSETLYLSLLLAGFLALCRAADGSRRWALAAGLVLGLATLTRSLTLGFLPVAAGWLLFQEPGARLQSAICNRPLPAVHRLRVKRSVRHPRSAIIFLLAAALVVLPWTAYNSRLFGGPVLVDTSGAFNLLLGARTAYDGTRRDAATRDFVLGLFPGQPPAAAPPHCAPYPGPLPSQAARQAAMTREAACLLAATPGAFVRKSLAELIDLFQINYSGDERFTDGFAVGWTPPWHVLGTFLLDDTLYVLALPLAVFGWGLARREAGDRGSRDAKWERRGSERRDHEPLAPSPLSLAPHLPTLAPGLITLIGLWWLYNLAVAPLLFAINRFRLPLMPFAFIFAAYAAVALVRGVRLQPRDHPWLGLCAALAALLTGVALASYLGPYPASLASTRLALAARPGYLAERDIQAAIQRGDAAAARARLAAPEVTPRTHAIAGPLLDGLEGHPTAGLARLAATPPELLEPWQAAVIRGDLLRSSGDEPGAKAAFTPEYVDSANPVQWAWDWLHPAPTRRIDLGGNLDLGYIAGCYLGEPERAERTTWRWCSDGARLRFPAAGDGRPLHLALRVDGRGWQGFAATPPPVQVFAGDRLAGAFQPGFAIDEYTVELPPAPPGADVIITLRTPTFIPGAADFNRQQGAQAGQARRLGVRLDWAELRP